MKALQAVNGPVPDAVTIWDSPVLMHRAMAVLETEPTITPRDLSSRVGVRLQQASDTLRYLVHHGCAVRVSQGTKDAPGSSVYQAAP